MEEKREQWMSRSGFILAAVGSAIGLGNIWRFPYQAYSDGGGAFLIPYFFALITAGIPLLILEFSLGHKFRGSAPLTFSKLGKFEWFGWWQTAVAFVIATYYSVIVAWAMAYTAFAIPQTWGPKPGDFLGTYLGLSDPSKWYAGGFGGLQWKVVVPLILVWAIVYFVLSRGVKGGIEKANKIFMPALFILIIIMAIRGITLPGAADGLNALFTPDWSRITDASVWVDAYGQIFFSLSIAFAIMITYASYLPKKSDINNNAFITAFANSGFSLLAGIAVFSTIGFMANQQGIPIDQVAKGGIGLAFTVFPEILNRMPMGQIIGVLFFISLVFAGLSSLISIVEAFSAAVSDKFNVPRKKAVNWAVGVAALVSLLFATGSGLFLLDTVDHFINNYGIAFAGLFEAIFLGWVLRQTKQIRTYNNELSDFKIGAWWDVFLIVITPVVLGYMGIQNLIHEFSKPYSGYPSSLLAVGWVIVVGVVVVGFILQAMKSINPEFAVRQKKEDVA